MIARSTLANALGVGQATMTLVDGSDFEDPDIRGEYQVIIWDSATEVDPSLPAAKLEIARVTGKTGNVFDIERGEAGTSDIAHQSGYSVALATTWFNLSDSVNVIDFGADPANTSDSYQALQDAIDATPDGGTLRIPAGIYQLSRGVRLADRTGVRIEAEGATFTYPNSVDETSTGYGIYLLRCVDCHVLGLIVDQNRANRTTATPSLANGLMAYDCTGITFERCAALNSTFDGFYLGTLNAQLSTGRCADISFIDCVADNATRNGLSVTNATDIRIIRGEYRNTQGEAPGAGIDIEPNDPSDLAAIGSERIYLEEVSFLGNAGYGLLITASKRDNPVSESFVSDVVVRGCIFHGSTVGGYHSEARVLVGENIIFSSCIFDGGSDINTASLSIEQGDGVNVNACIFRSATHGGNAIRVDNDSKNITITGNQVLDWNVGESSPEEAIQVDSDRPVITGNVIRRCGGRGINLTLSNDATCLGNTLEQVTDRGIVVELPGAIIRSNSIRDMLGSAPRALSIGASVTHAMVDGNVCRQSASQATGEAIFVGGPGVTIVGPNRVQNWSRVVIVDGSPEEEKSAEEILGAGGNSIQTGTLVLSPSPTSQKSIAFPIPYASPPRVFVMQVSAGGGSFWDHNVSGITTSGFNYLANNGPVGSDSIFWMAIGAA